MLNEAFLRDFFGMPAAKKAEPKPSAPLRQITIECLASDPIEIRAENIVKMIGFQGPSNGFSGFSVPQVSPAEATLRAIKVLRKYAEQDGQK